MNVIFIDYIKKEIGGGHFVLARLANYFFEKKEKNVTPYVFLNNYQGFWERFLLRLPNKEEYTIPVKILSLSRSSSLLKILGAIFQIIRFWYLFGLDLKRYAKNNNIDVIHANGITAFILCSIPAKLFRLKLIYHLHDALIGKDEGGNLGKYAQKFLVFFMHFFADRVIANSEFVRRTVLKRDSKIASKVVVVHNGINIIHYSSNIYNPNIPFLKIRSGKQKLHILSIGRLSKTKGFDLGIRAASILKEKYNIPFEYKVLGTGSYQPQLEKLREELNLEDYILFLGFQDNVTDFMTWADFVLIPSVWQEPFGLTVIESMLGGCLVIATKVGAIPEVIDHGKTGLLVSVQNAADEIANHMVKLIEEPEIYGEMVQNAAKRVREYFNMDRMAEEITAVYNSVLNI